jgi:hypothetical protein
MSKTFEQLRVDIEQMLVKFKSSTDLEEKQQLLKKIQLALAEAGELADCKL